MSIIVQKFGGTSVADSQKILAAARKAIRAQKDGHQVVMVVSAMGKHTDALINLAREITEEPPAREMDMLLSTGEQVSVALMAMAVHSLGHEAISMTGAQIGIVTDSTHTKARIKSISTDRLRGALDQGKIVIAAGFQGMDEAFNITTLGRGGSDTTAVALAAVLGADSCEIYTDVDGVYTTDPRMVPEARRVDRISYDEMLELASAGASVMHNRSIEFAKKFSVPVHVRSSFSDQPGTMITDEPEAPGMPVCGAAKVKTEALLTVLGVPDRPGAALTIFSRIAEKHIPMDMIVQNVGAEGHADISFTVFRDDLPAALKAVETATAELDVEGCRYDDDVSKISVVGAGMATQPGVAERMFLALAEKGINILMITTSEIKISVLVERQFAQEALLAVHEAFTLDVPPAEPGGDGDVAKARVATNNTAELVARLERMEELLIEDITLDASQARVTVVDLADIPGLAAQVFGEIAEAGISVDMIVQSVGRKKRANLSFTVAEEDLQRSLKVTAELSEVLGCPPPTSCPQVAKLSVFGIGMRSHTDVASRMFRSLAAAGINVDMISTSEVRVNVVVDRKDGEKALAALRQEFADVKV
ncbi:MAG TPA: aspartate kinase [Thermoguttaceae bacterium]|nr:aspartate kinase [Thermoguttaceae bacterium]